MLDSNRIVGGQDATSPIPWQASIERGCGAIVLDAKTLLSAAHCYEGQTSINDEIRVGSIYRDIGGQV